MSLFATKPIESLVSASDQAHQPMRRVLGPVDLTTLGIGAIIGTGIFVLTGQAAAMYAGPGIVAVDGHRRRRQRPCRALLCGIRVIGPGGRLGLHLRLRDAWRVGRLGHRMGPDPGIRAGRGDGRRRLVWIRRRDPQGLRPAVSAAVQRRAGDGGRARRRLHRHGAVQPAGDADLARGDAAARARHSRVGARQRRRRRDQSLGGPLDHRDWRDVRLVASTGFPSFLRTTAGLASMDGAACCAAPA